MFDWALAEAELRSRSQDRALPHGLTTVPAGRIWRAVHLLLMVLGLGCGGGGESGSAGAPLPVTGTRPTIAAEERHHDLPTVRPDINDEQAAGLREQVSVESLRAPGLVR